jgi:hypothetical protein
MRQYSQFQNPVEDHYITALDLGRSLAMEAEEWLRARRQIRAEEAQRLEEFKTAQREKDRRAAALFAHRLKQAGAPA